jgi:DNA replication protein DnaD
MVSVPPKKSGDKLNYIKQLNAFYDWRLLNDLSGKEQVLYLTLLHLNNKCGWKKEFNAPNRTLELLCSIDRSALNKLRNNLIQKGLIEYKKGRKGKAGLYKIKCLYMCNYYTGLDTNTDTHLDTNPDTNIATIPKQKQNKTKKEVVEEQRQKLIGECQRIFNGNVNMNGVLSIAEYLNKGMTVDIVIQALNKGRLKTGNQAQAYSYANKVLLNWYNEGKKDISDLTDVKEDNKQSKPRQLYEVDSS